MTPRDTVLVEACVDSVTSARAAEAGGAARLELCAGLVEGGTTPSAGMIAAVREAAALPLFVLVRPRAGDFLYGEDDWAVIRADVASARRLGADGFVFGALTDEGRVDGGALRAFREAAGSLPLTFHRAFDLSRDPREALDALIALGVDRVLTSGQAPTALEGAPLLAELVARAAGRIEVLAGGGIDESNAREIVRKTGVREIHLRGGHTTPSPMAFRREGVFMGKPYQPDEYRRQETDARRIRAVVRSIAAP